MLFPSVTVIWKELPPDGAAVTAKLALERPAGTITELGMLNPSDAPADVIITRVSPAVRDNDNSHCAVAPGNTVAGVQLKDKIRGGARRVNVVVRETPPKAAVTATGSSDVGVADTALKDAVVAPESTVTEGGTVRSGLLLVNEMTFPVPVAAALKMIVQAAVAPGSRVAGRQASDEIPVALALRKNAMDKPFQLAVSTAVLFAGAGLTCAVKVALLCPGEIVTAAGTLTSGPPVSESETDSDPMGLFNVTVQLSVAAGERIPELHTRD
jgi:hypothetical protein